MPRLFFSGCLFLCSIYRQQHSFLSTSLFCKIKMPNFSLASHYKVGSVPLVSCSWAECLGMSLFAHEALHRCHVPTTPMFCSSFVWPCLMQPTTLFFIPVLQCWTFMILGIIHSPGLFSVLLSLKFLIEILMVQHNLECFGKPEQSCSSPPEIRLVFSYCCFLIKCIVGFAKD